MRTYVRERRRGDDPPRGPRRLLRVGRAARRPAAARAPRDRRRRRGAHRELRGAGTRRSGRDGGRASAPAVPARGRRVAADVRLLRGQQGGLRDLRGHDAAGGGTVDRRGVPRRARPRPYLGSPEEIAARLKRRVLEQVGLPITVGVARTKFLAKVASGVAKPDGLLVVPPGGELEFLHPLPVERLWGVGEVTARKLHARGIRTVGQVARIAETDWWRWSARASGRQLHALAHNRDPRRVRVGAPAALDRLPACARPAVAEAAGRPRRAGRRRSSTGWRAACAEAGVSAARSCCGCASATSRARPAPTPSARPPPAPRRSSPPRASCWRRRCR